jgi:hypothetical protein
MTDATNSFFNLSPMLSADGMPLKKSLQIALAAARNSALWLW